MDSDEAMDEADYIALLPNESEEDVEDLGVASSYVVNLRRRPERWRTFVDAALAAGQAWLPLVESARFDAVDGAATVISATSALRKVCRTKCWKIERSYDNDSTQNRTNHLFFSLSLSLSLLFSLTHTSFPSLA